MLTRAGVFHLRSVFLPSPSFRTGWGSAAWNSDCSAPLNCARWQTSGCKTWSLSSESTTRLVESAQKVYAMGFTPGPTHGLEDKDPASPRPVSPAITESPRSSLRLRLRLNRSIGERTAGRLGRRWERVQAAAGGSINSSGCTSRCTAPRDKAPAATHGRGAEALDGSERAGTSAELPDRAPNAHGRDTDVDGWGANEGAEKAMGRAGAEGFE